MGFHEISLALNPEYGSSFVTGFRNVVTELKSGAVEVQSHDERPRRVIDIRAQVQSEADAAALLTFFHARGGARNGFRVRDWSDYTTAADRKSAPGPTDRVIGIGDGVKTQFQLATDYIDNHGSLLRPIRKPVFGTVRVAVNGIELTEAVNWTVNTTTGIVTFVTPPTPIPVYGATVTAGCEFEVPVRFSPETDKRLANVFDSYSLRRLEQVLLIEDIDPTNVQSERHFGGGRSFGAIAADVTVELLDGCVLTFNPSTSGLKVILPDPATMPAGSGHFEIFNESLSYSLRIVDAVGTTVLLMPAASAARFCVPVLDALSTQAWRAV